MTPPRRPRRRDQRGFTLMEFLVVGALAVLVLGALHGFQRAQLFAMREQETRVEAQAATRATLDVMLREVRMAGYSGPCPNDVAAIVEAQPDRIRFQIDWNEDGVVGAGEDITYAYDGDSAEIRRTVTGDGDDLAIPVIANVASSDIFRYLDGAGAETATLSDIRSVEVDVRVARANPRPDVPSQLVSGLEAAVEVRNSGFECEEEEDDGDDSSSADSGSGSGGSGSGSKDSKSGKSSDSKSKDDQSKDDQSKDDQSKDDQSKDDQSKDDKSKDDKSKDDKSKDDKSDDSS